MPEPAADETMWTAPDPGRIAAVESLIGLAQSQISAGLSRGANIDTLALGLIGLDVGLLAVAVAAQEALGALWWAAVPGLAVSLVIAGSVGPSRGLTSDPDRSSSMSRSERPRCPVSGSWQSCS